MTQPIRKRILVPVPPEAAFDLFTGDIAKWWPGESHSLSAADNTTPKDIRVDPFEGGHIVEETHDGRSVPWATVTDWSPGRRFSVDWYVGKTEAEATQVAVVFAPVEGGTSVELTHDGFDRVPAGETMAATYNSGWDHVLGHCYGGACTARAA